MQRGLNQKVNFYISVSVIAVFGFLITVTLVQALNKDAPLLTRISSPIDIQIDSLK